MRDRSEKKEIEVTPAMIEAGERYLYEFSLDKGREDEVLTKI